MIWINVPETIIQHFLPERRPEDSWHHENARKTDTLHGQIHCKDHKIILNGVSYICTIENAHSLGKQSSVFLRRFIKSDGSFVYSMAEIQTHLTVH